MSQRQRINSSFFRSNFGKLTPTKADTLAILVGSTEASRELRRNFSIVDEVLVSLENEILQRNTSLNAITTDKSLYGSGYWESLRTLQRYLEKKAGEIPVAGFKEAKTYLNEFNQEVLPTFLKEILIEFGRRQSVIKSEFSSLAGRLKLYLDKMDELRGNWLSGWKSREEKWSAIDQVNATIKFGTVYVMKNQVDPEVHKVGFTTRDPRVRATELDKNYEKYGTFEVVYSKECDFPYVVEQRTFDKLRLKVVSAELVREDFAKIVRVIDQCCEEVSRSIRDGEVKDLEGVYDPARLPKRPTARFKTGEWLRHSTYGVGWIQASAEGLDIVYTVYFKNGKLRKTISSEDSSIEPLTDAESRRRPQIPQWWTDRGKVGKRT